MDDPESPLKLAYTLSKPLKLGWAFGDTGCYKFVLQEVDSTDDDNQELGIADYYLHFPKDGGSGVDDGESAGGANDPGTGDNGNPTGKRVWL